MSGERSLASFCWSEDRRAWVDVDACSRLGCGRPACSMICLAELNTTFARSLGARARSLLTILSDAGDDEPAFYLSAPTTSDLPEPDDEGWTELEGATRA